MQNLFILCSLLLLHGPLCGQKAYWQQHVDYSIDVTLDASRKTLNGFETIHYSNRSPDTLSYIWFHLYPNAYKHDRTAFSDDLLRMGDTRFYFSKQSERGYINGLQWKVDGTAASAEDHPQHGDILKLLLPKPLPPGGRIEITTPFHVQLPRLFSRSGWDKNTFHVAQWYPKPAVYDAAGWHPMPYLEQGEFYSEFGDFKITITLPAGYHVAASGALLNGADGLLVDATKEHTQPRAPASPPLTKTLSYQLFSAHDFAFFAGLDYKVQHDTLSLVGDTVITVAAFYPEQDSLRGKEAITTVKEAVRFFSSNLGTYPYATISIVQAASIRSAGMEYPGLALLNGALKGKLSELTLVHEVAHNWFYGILGSNERAHPWMDEGMSTFYERKWERANWERTTGQEALLFRTLAARRKDQPINTSAPDFSLPAYGLVAYQKSAEWLELLEARMGPEAFRNAMKRYYEKWRFRHPRPQDFERVFTSENPAAAPLFPLLQTTGVLPGGKQEGTRVLTPFYPAGIRQYIAAPTQKAVAVTPLPGYNRYDGVMLGVLATNYVLPPAPFQFLLVPMYATVSEKFNGILKLNYTLQTAGRIGSIDIGVTALQFSKRSGRDSNGRAHFERWSKVVPRVRATFKENPADTKETFAEARTYLLAEKDFSKFVTKSTDNLTYVDSSSRTTRYINTLIVSHANNRVLYPYMLQLSVHHGSDWYRVNLEGSYYFNYANGGGASARLFAAKFGYTRKEPGPRFTTLRYQPKLLGVTGEEDYTYSNYFLGRTASFANDMSVSDNGGLAAQQVMVRDGALKLRIDPYAFLQGRSEDWVTALNLTTTLPPALLPFALPLRLFLDIGTYSEAWGLSPPTARFLYTGGLQASFLKNAVHVYVPLIYSSEFKSYLKTLPEQKGLAKRITFSIDLHRLSHRTIFGNLSPL